MIAPIKAQRAVKSKAQHVIGLLVVSRQASLASSVGVIADPHEFTEDDLLLLQQLVTPVMVQLGRIQDAQKHAQDISTLTLSLETAKGALYEHVNSAEGEKRKVEDIFRDAITVTQQKHDEKVAKYEEKLAVLTTSLQQQEAEFAAMDEEYTENSTHTNRTSKQLKKQVEKLTASTTEAQNSALQLQRELAVLQTEYDELKDLHEGEAKQFNQSVRQDSEMKHTVASLQAQLSSMQRTEAKHKSQVSKLMSLLDKAKAVSVHDKGKSIRLKSLLGSCKSELQLAALREKQFVDNEIKLQRKIDKLTKKALEYKAKVLKLER
jgi:hypothetical protein